MSKIIVNEIFETLIDIETELSNCREHLQNINDTFSDVAKSSIKLYNYNEHPKINGIDQKGKYTNSWSISVPDALQKADINFKPIMEETESAIDDLNNQINNDEDIAHYIESQINELEKNMDSSQLALAFGALSSSIAIDSYGVANNKFVTISDENMQYWIDNSLQFQWDSKAGAYLILQKDSNGNLVAMGWTDRNSVLNYVKKLEEISNNVDNDTSDQKKDNNSSDQNQEKESKVSSIYDTELTDSEIEEIRQYANADILGTESEKKDVYSKLSDRAKDIIDGKIEVVEKTIPDYVDNREDIVIPKGKILSNIGTSNAVPGDVLKYFPDKGKYYKINDNGEASGMGYTLNDLADGKWIDQ